MYIKAVIGDYTRTDPETNEEIQHQSAEVLVNIDCPIRIIYDYIQQSLEIECELEFDLCDENGNLISIYEKEPWINGTNFLEPKATYFVVLFERDEENRPTNPMLYIPEKNRKSNTQANDILVKIKKQLHPTTGGSKHSRTIKSRSSVSNHVK